LPTYSKQSQTSTARASKGRAGQTLEQRYARQIGH
jgi:hypothetical protein